jgi:glycosyltransferase involved in cell wall biosynthesis
MSGILMQNYERLSKIGFFSPLNGVGVDCGYGYAAVELIKAWQRQGIPVWSHDREAPIVFNMGQPHFYERVEGAVNIAYTPWESTDVPKSWIVEMNKMDYMLTTCKQNADSFIAAGLKPSISVLPHGINRSHYPLKKRTLDGPFKFLHIGGDAPRKGAELLLDVFTDKFSENDDVQLTLKSGSVNKSLKSRTLPKNVIVIQDKYNQSEMTQLYLDHHGMIYPTKGEGFGLIPFQAAATGMPTAVTEWGGALEYIKLCYPIRVRGLVEADYEPHIGLWADPDPDSVALWMDYFVNSPHYYFSNAYRKAHLMDRNWSWDAIAKDSLMIMSQLLDPYIEH